MALRSTVSRSFRLLLCLLMAGALLLDTAAPASAWEPFKKGGRPGRVAIPSVSVWDHYRSGGPILAFSATGPRVRRTPRSRRAQDVNVVRILQRWDGSKWVNAAQDKSWRRIRRGRAAVRLPELYMNYDAKGSYRLIVVVSWYKARTQDLIAFRFFRASAASDFTCMTDRRPCQANNGYVRVGAHAMFGGGW